MVSPTKTCGCESELVPLRVGPLSRRRFLQILGAAGVAGLPGCYRPPPDPVAPYARMPEGVTPGNAQHYASALAFDGVTTGVVVTAYEGRPTKIEGNTLHPASLGATGAWEQAALIDLYDPARLTSVGLGRGGIGRAEFLEHMRALAKRHEPDGGAGLHLLLAPSSSPSVGATLERLRARFPKSTSHTYRPLDRSAGLRAARTATGKLLATRAHLDRADVVVALDSDFMSFGPERLRLSHEWADRRTVAKSMNRLYVAETQVSLMGAMADARLPAKPSELPRIASELLRAVAGALGASTPAELRALPAANPPLPEFARAFVQASARDLVAHRGRAVVLANESADETVQLAAFALNQLLAGAAVELLPPVELEPLAGPGALTDLVEAIGRGEVKTLLCTAFDPVYTGPADLGVRDALAKVPELIQLAHLADETTAVAGVRVPRSHPLESWGDVRAFDGTVSLVQPLIAPLYDSFTELELLSTLADDVGHTGYALLRGLWQPKLGAEFESRWRVALQDGLLAGSANAPVAPNVDWAAVAGALSRPLPPPPEGLELHLAEDRKIRTGEFTHNPWLQECPDALTQLAWDNALLLNPKTANSLGLELASMVELSVDGKKVVAPVMPMPGQAEGAVTVHLGYGHTIAANANERVVGFNAFQVRTRRAASGPVAATLRKLEGGYRFGLIQIEGSDQGRPISVEVEASELPEKLADLAHLRQEHPVIFPRYAYPGYRWAMAIDLSRCIGCQACVVACRAENNVPIVGRDEVMRGREMHWLRVDRYFAGDVSAPHVRFHPLMCQHCEDAPCEYVCPVNATVHSDEGLNEMVYNRCIGTRYCSNNCPYKVRRFNFHAYADQTPSTEQLAYNPEVTVRSRGVMEKCSYCVQRIERVRIDREIAGEMIRDGDIQTACQQVCPTEAIKFGSLSDAEGVVSTLHADVRRYDLLGELNTFPRTAYLARLTNRAKGL